MTWDLIARGTENFFNVETFLVALAGLAIGFLNVLPCNEAESVLVTFFKDTDSISLTFPPSVFPRVVESSAGSSALALLVFAGTAAFNGRGATKRGRLNAPLPPPWAPGLWFTRFLYIVSQL